MCGAAPAVASGLLLHCSCRCACQQCYCPLSMLAGPSAPLQVPLDQLVTPTAGLFPEFEHFEVFAGQRPDEPYRWAGSRAGCAMHGA